MTDPGTNPSGSTGGVLADSLLQIDDGVAEGVFGFSGPGTRPFLFFNRFESPGAFYLEAIEVLFPAGTEIAPGDAVQLVVYSVPRGASAADADLVLQLDEQVQTTDGSTFSSYPLADPLEFLGGDDVLIGVINRYYVTGTMPEQTRPAAIDATAPAGSSFFALWAGDAEDPPELSSAVEISPLDGFVAANFMIRGEGRLAPVVDVPALDGLGALLLFGLLLTAALLQLRRHG